jgi:hypothetical protein
MREAARQFISTKDSSLGPDDQSLKIKELLGEA